MGPQHLSSVRLSGGPALSSRRFIADVTVLRSQSSTRRCKRRQILCAKAASKAAGRTGTFKLGGGSKRPTNKKQSSASGPRTVQLRRGSDTLKLAMPAKMKAPRRGPRDSRTVFVAGATGRLGSRVVRALLQEGLRVLAGARDVDAAQESIAIATQFGVLTTEQARRVRVVPFNITDNESIASAIGNAGKVVSAMGASGGDILVPWGPRNVDSVGTRALINVASDLGVEQFVLVTSIGTGKFGWPAGSTNILWGILAWKRTAEVALEQSGMAYTIVRPGGIERPADTFKETHNLTLSSRDQLFGGQVSRLQIAELIAACCTNPSLAENKTLEAVADDTAPKLGCLELLEKIPSEVSQEERLKAKEMAAQIQRDIAAAEKRIEDLTNVSEDLGERAAALQARVKEFKAAERGVISGSAATERAAVRLQNDLEALRGKAQALARQETAARAVLTALQKAGRAGKLLTKQEQDAIALPILQPELTKKKAEEEAQAAAAAKAKAAAQAQKEASQQGRRMAAAVPTVQIGADLTTKVVVGKPKKAATVTPKATKPSRPQVLAPTPTGAKGLKSPVQKIDPGRETKRQAEEKLRAELVAQLETEQRAREKASEEAWKKAEAAAIEKAKAATAAKVAGAAKAKQAPQRAAAGAAEAKKKKAMQEAKAKAAEKAKLGAEAEAKRVAQVEEEKRRNAQAEEEAKKKKEAKAKAQADELQKKKKAAAVAAAKPAGGFGGWTWPWEASGTKASPEPEELIARRKEAQAWIADWRAGTGNGVRGERVAKSDEPEKKKREQESGKAVKVAEPKAAATKTKVATVPKPKAATVTKAKEAAAKPAAGVFGGWTWPWEASGPGAPIEPEELIARRKEAQAWIADWRARTENGAPENMVGEAREWIRDWQAKNVEEKLPK